MQLYPDPSQTVDGLSRQIASGGKTCLEVLETCLARIEELETTVRAWVVVDTENAIRTAKDLDDDLLKGKYRGALHGIPVGVKDIIDVVGLPTSAGSQLLGAQPAREDATVIARLRSAGAIILGKTTAAQYACSDPPATRNPWDMTRSPGGSSSGSAAAVASGMCPCALGSQSGGSITRPAAFCGIVGCKPSFHRISMYGLLPLAYSLDHPGFMARSVRDIAIMHDAISGMDTRDCQTLDMPSSQLSSSFDGIECLQPKIGILSGFFRTRADEVATRAFDAALDTLCSSGAVVSNVELPDSFEEIHEHIDVVMETEIATVHEERFRKLPDDYLPGIASEIKRGLNTPVTKYVRSRLHQERAKREAEALVNQVDLLACPATIGPATDPSTTGNPALNSPWSYTGLPTICLPVALTENGLPLGIQFVGHPNNERKLFRAVAWCELQLRNAHLLAGGSFLP